jgi:predicted TIM-barrel fold metal-dependent hydrolase
MHLQVSAFFRISKVPYPYEDVQVPVRNLIDTYGAQRIMWGTDFPWVTETCGYENAWQVLPDGFLSDEEREWIMSGTFLSLFPSLAGRIV